LMVFSSHCRQIA